MGMGCCMVGMVVVGMVGKVVVGMVLGSFQQLEGRCCIECFQRLVCRSS